MVLALSYRWKGILFSLFYYFNNRFLLKYFLIFLRIAGKRGLLKTFIGWSWLILRLLFFSVRCGVPFVFLSINSYGMGSVCPNLIFHEVALDLFLIKHCCGLEYSSHLLWLQWLFWKWLLHFIWRYTLPLQHLSYEIIINTWDMKFIKKFV